MTSFSIIKESKTKKNKWKKNLIIILFLILTIFGIYYWYNQKNNNIFTETAPEIVEVKKEDLKISIETDGKIVNPDISNLSFFVNGTIDKIHVSEGDIVKKGDILAELDKKDFQLELKTAQNDVAIATSNIAVKKSEIINLDLITAEQDYEISQQNLKDKIEELNQKVDQVYEDANLDIKKAIDTINTALQKIDALFLIERHNSDVNYIITSFHDFGSQNSIENDYKKIRLDLDNFLTNFYLNQNNTNMLHYFIDEIIKISSKTKVMIDTLVDVFKTAVASYSISASEIDQARNTIISEQTQINNIINSLIESDQNIDRTLLEHKNGIQETNNALEKSQTKFENTEKTYEQKQFSKENELKVLQAKLNQSITKVEQAQYDLEQATLKSPIDGEIIIINGNIGESIKSDNTSADTAFIRIMSNSNFTVEVNVEEVDIAKIKKDQKVYITTEAIEDIILEGKVVYISSIASSDNNGVVTYLVRVEIIDTKGAPIKEGMTAYTEFVIGEANQVLTLPIKAIYKNPRGSQSVTLENGKNIKIETGFSDGKNIEIKSGINEGDKILIQNSKQTSVNTINKKGGIGMRNFSEERIEQLKSAGFSNEMIEKMKKGEFTEEMKELMQKFREKNNTGGSSGGRMRMPH